MMSLRTITEFADLHLNAAMLCASNGSSSKVSGISTLVSVTAVASGNAPHLSSDILGHQ